VDGLEAVTQQLAAAIFLAGVQETFVEDDVE
jgi:hypothetical protein